MRAGGQVVNLPCICMKKLFAVALLLAPLVMACSKSAPEPDVPVDNGCAEQTIMPVTAHSISAADVLIANNLFAANAIDYHRFRYYRYSLDSTPTYYPPYATLRTQSVRVEQYVNGLKLFSSELNYSFKDGIFYFLAGNPTPGTGLNTTPALSAGQLRGLFFATIAQHDPTKIGLQNQCVRAEFGYYNLNASTGNTNENLVKAWRVQVKNQAYPFAYYQDSDGKLIYYDNGIQTFR